jgi:Zn-dependent protease
LFELPPPQTMLVIGIVIFLAIGLHEYGHAKAADLAGDPTPGIQGRVTLNLTKHFEPMGTIMILITSLTGYGIGWGKPVMVNPQRMANPRWDHFVSVAAGPFMNVLQATVYALLLRLMIMGGMFGTDPFSELLFYGILINLSLCFFNLIPFGPLDGHWLIGAFLPEKQRYYWYKFNRSWGTIILFGMILIGQFSGLGFVHRIIRPPVDFMFRLLTGI